MRQISIGTLVILILQFFLTELAFAGESSMSRGIRLQSWSEETLVKKLSKDESLLIALTDSIVRQLIQDEEFSNLHSVQATEIQEGDSDDELYFRFTAKDKRWESAGLIIFDAEIRVLAETEVGSMTVTSWTLKTSGSYNANGPRYDLPRAIIIKH